MNLSKISLKSFFTNKERIIFSLKQIILFDICFFIFAAPFNKLLAKISFLFGILLWVITKILRKREDKLYKSIFPKTILNRALFIFLVSVLISVILSVNFGLSQRIFFERYIPYALFFFLVYFIVSDSEKNIYFIVSSLLLSGALIGTGALRDYFISPSGRISTVFGIKANFATYLTMFIPLSFTVLFSNSKKIIRYLSFVAFVLLCLFFVVHGSRGVWVTVLISLIPVLLFVKRKYLIVILLAVLLGFIYVPKVYKERAATIKSIFTQSSTIIRKDLFVAAYGMFKERPVFGSGPGAFEKLSYEGKRDIHAHNMFIEVMGETGIVGLSGFLIIIFTFLARFIKNLSIWGSEDSSRNVISTAAGAAIFAGLVLNLSYSSILVGFQDSMIFWLILAIAVYGKDPGNKLNYKNNIEKEI